MCRKTNFDDPQNLDRGWWERLLNLKMLLIILASHHSATALHGLKSH